MSDVSATVLIIQVVLVRKPLRRRIVKFFRRLGWFAFIPVFFAAVNGRAKDIEISAGMPVLAWSKADSIMECVIHIKAPEKEGQRRDPIQVLVLLDVSREMQGRALQHAKEGIKAVVGGLHDRDVFGLIAYSNVARTVLPLQPLTEGGRESAERTIDGVTDEDNRDLNAGFKEAAKQLERLSGNHNVGSYLFLITNGDPNTGTTSADGLLESALKIAEKHGISISTFGIEKEFNEQLLGQMADRTLGRAYFIRYPEQAVAPLSQEIKRISDAVVRNVSLTLKPPSTAKIGSVQGALRDGENLKIGAMAPGDEHMIMVELLGPPQKQKDCVIDISWIEPSTQSTRRTTEYVDIPLTEGESDYNRDFAPFVLAVELENFLVENSGKMKSNRKQFADVFRDKLLALEQENAVLNSEYLKEAVTEFGKLEHELANTAIDDEEMEKVLKYRLRSLFRQDKP